MHGGSIFILPGHRLRRQWGLWVNSPSRPPPGPSVLRRPKREWQPPRKAAGWVSIGLTTTSSTDSQEGRKESTGEGESCPYPCPFPPHTHLVQPAQGMAHLRDMHNQVLTLSVQQLSAPVSSDPHSLSPFLFSRNKWVGVRSLHSQKQAFF